ncbi:MAG: glycosyltransferase family 9 protein [Chloroflexi bacterium]|nr:glycosyltransferase family 9 protein [Chloroflexota bacterium]
MSQTTRQRVRLALLRAVAKWPRPRSQRLGHRILIIRPDHLGDLLFLTPALRILRIVYPGAHITALVGPWATPVVAHNPHLNAISTCEFPAFTRRAKGGILAPYRQLWREANELRRGTYDSAVIFRFDHWWGAMLVWLAGIPFRLGYDVPECRPFLTEAVPYICGRHEVEQNLHLVEALCGRPLAKPIDPRFYPLEYTPTNEDRESVSQYLVARGVERDAILVAIHPGAGAPVKLWDPAKYAVVADALVRGFKAQVVITGGRDELSLAWSVAARMMAPAIVAAGETTIGQLAALFERCALVIGPDSGPLHLAVAVGVPTVHLYGPVDTNTFGPWGDPARHIVVRSERDCIPCNRLDYSPQELAAHPCVQEITTESVLNAAQRILG